MSVIDSPRNRWPVAASWLVFASLNIWLMFLFPGEETIPYHIVWASFALMYGLYAWPAVLTWVAFSAVTVATGIPLIEHALALIIGWEECSEIVLMGVLVAIVIWHVDRHRLAQAKLEELRETERVRSHNRDIAARFGSHEVKTRLTIAHGFVELMRDAATDEVQRGDAEVVLAELEKATGLTTRLLELVRFETAARRESVDLYQLIDAVLRRWEITAERDWSSAIEVETITADPERLEAALDCLIENAVKFTSPGDSIEIDVQLHGSEVEISVKDSGAGIPADDLGRITEIFETGATAGDRAGSGLGLAIVGAVVAARGGTLKVSSIEGSETSITMCVPVEPFDSTQLTIPCRSTAARSLDGLAELRLVDVNAGVLVATPSPGRA